MMQQDERDAGAAVDLDGLGPDGRYKFLTAAVVPRPIALVVTQDRAGSPNVAPFSQFIILSPTPPILGIVLGRTETGHKDSFRNIDATRRLSINTVTETMAEAVQRCALPFLPGVNEAELTGLDLIPGPMLGVPLVAQSPIRFECRVQAMMAFGTSRSTLVAAEVVAAQARPGLVSGHRVDHAAHAPLGRIAGRAYCRTSEVIHVGPEVDAPFLPLPPRVPDDS